MSQLTWLEKYSNQSTDELLALEGKFRTDSIIAAFQEALDQKLEKEGKEALSEEEWTILAVEALENEVNNNGYSGFLTNYSKEYASVIVDSLARINCREVAKLTAQAIDSLGIKEPLNVEAIDRSMGQENEERDAVLQNCDSAYYAKAGDLADPLLEYIKAHKEKIILHR